MTNKEMYELIVKAKDTIEAVHNSDLALSVSSKEITGLGMIVMGLDMSDRRMTDWLRRSVYLNTSWYKRVALVTVFTTGCYDLQAQQFLMPSTSDCMRNFRYVSKMMSKRRRLDICYYDWDGTYRFLRFI